MTEESHEVDESLGLFEAAIRAGKVKVALPRVEKISLVVDGSDQSATAAELAEVLARRLGADFEDCGSGLAGGDAAETAARIRACAGPHDLLVLPAPFGEDIGSLKSESLSSVIDLMLAETRKPLLLVRRPIDDPAAVLGHPIGLLEWHEDLQVAVASWSALLAGTDGRVSLLTGHDPVMLDELRAVFDDHESDLEAFESMLKRAETRLAGGLVGAMQKLGDARGFALDFENLGAANLAREVAERAVDQDGLAVAAHRRGHGGPSGGRVRELILRSTGPVLTIPV